MKRSSWWQRPALTEYLGMVISDDKIFACLVRGGVEYWTECVPIHDGDVSLHSTVARLVEICPWRAIGRRLITVAFGPDRASTKRLPAFPSTNGVSGDHIAILARAQEHGPILETDHLSRLFILPFTSARASNIWRSANGEEWATVFDADAVDSVTRAIQSHRVGGVTIIPAAELLPAGAELRDSRLTIQAGVPGSDGLCLLTVSTSGTDAPGNAVSGGNLAAAAARAHTPRMRPVSPARSRVAARSNRRVSTLLPVLTGAVLGGLLAVAVSHQSNVKALSTSESRLALHSSRADSLRELQRSRAAIVRFDRTRVSLLEVLAEVAVALDTVGWVESMVITDSTVSLRVHAVSGAVVPRALKALSWVHSARLEGSIIRDAASGDSSDFLERASVLLVRTKRP